jgi:hypothetical protein
MRYDTAAVLLRGNRAFKLALSDGTNTLLEVDGMQVTVAAPGAHSCGFVASKDMGGNDSWRAHTHRVHAPGYGVFVQIPFRAGAQPLKPPRRIMGMSIVSRASGPYAEDWRLCSLCRIKRLDCDLVLHTIYQRRDRTQHAEQCLLSF